MQRSKPSNNAKRQSRSKTVSDAFNPTVWKQAVELASQYQLVISQDPDVGYFGRTVEMPFAMSDGKTVEKCVANVIEATASGIAAMLESGERPPSPSREGKREQQLNLRVSGEEKLRLEAAADREGYRSVSDFVRAVALRAT